MENALKLPEMPKKEEMELSFIPREEVLIAWNPVEPKESGREIELKVFFWNKEEIEKYDRFPKNNDPFRSFICSTGACCYHWDKLTTPELICECWKILIDYPLLDQKESLLQFSKIKELEALREMTFNIYFYNEYDGDYEAFLNTHFGA